mmetsp:Transcript_19871/g.29772  ORF Transcript_19871/g.29772 Transcript_19871/m.29772 type:complete len:112 (-) Transcript_19871:85-420(-)
MALTAKDQDEILDSSDAIRFYEAQLENVQDAVGITHESVPSIAHGLAILYEMKAGFQKEIAAYSKAIEMLELAQNSLKQQLGASATHHPLWADLDRQMAKLERKLIRRKTR